MTLDRAIVRAPSTIANVGPGFDVFGIALDEPCDRIEVRRTDEPGVRVESIVGTGSYAVTLDNTKNTAAVAAAQVLKAAGADFGIAMKINKGIRPASGMGSSGASAAGGAFAANLLLPRPLDMNTLIMCASYGEEASSGSRHADNAAPALMGGFTIIRSYEPMDVVRLTPPKDMGIVASLPEFAVPTREARKKVPKTVPMQDVIHQVGHASSLVAGMATGDLDLIARSINDVIVEPARAPLVPFLKDAESAALKAGAFASFLGGSGPCIAAFYDRSKVDGTCIARAVQKFYEGHGVECFCWVTSWGEGCRGVEE
ncbi:MAG: Homoserine kinase [Methanomassiliicoccales archaeon PtaB.Bin215]|nr:MAG: Homoserine kinase [Methanomassiliicoccales archaeon PtaB.Bin215]